MIAPTSGRLATSGADRRRSRRSPGRSTRHVRRRAPRPRPPSRRRRARAPSARRPEIVAGMPAARSRRTNARDAGHRRAAVVLVQPVLGARPGASRDAGSAPRPGAPRGRRSRAASSCGTLAGSRPRAFAVDSSADGTNTTGTTSADGSSRRECGPAPSVQARVNPPDRQAATLSGCPSSSVASSKQRGPRRDQCSPPTARARAARMPATIAAAEDPRPRPCGMRFAHTTSSPCGCPPSAANPARRARTIRCDSSRGSVAGALPRDVDHQA